jgi:hypothetical protein
VQRVRSPASSRRTKPLLIRAPWGLGDAIYVRPVIRDACLQREIYLETPWPELYSDLPVHFVLGHKGLRLQWRNVQRQDAKIWETPPPGIDQVALGYGPLELEAADVFTAVCDIQVDRELLANGVMPPHNVALTKGELTVRQLLATVRDAAVVVGPVGWIVPACVALGTPAFVVLGGNGGMNAPDRLLHPKMAADHIGFAMPKVMCMCMDMRHECEKSIPDLDAQWRRWRTRLKSRLRRPSPT